MKILLVSPTESGIGGIAQVVQGLANFLQKHGHIVDIISSKNSFTIPIKGLKNPSFMLSAAFKARSKKDYDIVHVFNIPAALALKYSKGKKIISIHGIFSKQVDMLHGKNLGQISDKYEKKALEWADVITVGSKEGQEFYSSLGFDVKYIPNAINIESLPKGTDRRYDKQVIYVGRLSKEKGAHLLPDIAKNLPKDIHLLVVGVGPELDEITKNSSGLTNIHLLGYQPKDKVIPLIRGSDILIQPSFAEGISSTLLEAMACKVPIVATKVGGNKEILSDEQTGILVEVGMTDQMVNGIVELLNNKEKSDRFAHNALNEVKKYDWNRVGPEYISLYTSLLQ
ncbi:MAG: glycosyltransferase family 4 protein [Candidatus Nitrosotenuis sp.]